MMGHTHALSGAAAWLLVAPGLVALPGVTALREIPVLGGLAGDLTPIVANALSPAELVAGAVVCAGAAMLPDLDHPHATIAQTFGPATWVLSKAVNWLSGGHRHMTHSLLFALAAGFGAHLLADGHPIGRDVLVILMIGLALRAVGIGIPGRTMTSAMVNIGLTAAAFILLRAAQVGYLWLGFAIAIGCLAHVIGDCLTERGCPVLWPLRHRWLLPWKIGIKTGRAFEIKILGPLLSVVVLGLFALRLLPSL
ncbi:membrane protein [Sphaerisporangium melleum]|uniref:Membrane protein n=1 Tax=Sphaerisporangium melleum TaxID=321316 RepID=A0A917QWG3_9ACTN|nr:metal-dependent hydrolase [Sphaerisporangium melleum]GGK72652.1 membrane protein [Sphaerisporangium melleum]GII68314.1 membrane protein [Sphaerisporangium melleum]